MMRAAAIAHEKLKKNTIPQKTYRQPCFATRNLTAEQKQHQHALIDLDAMLGVEASRHTHTHTRVPCHLYAWDGNQKSKQLSTFQNSETQTQP